MSTEEKKIPDGVVQREDAHDEASADQHIDSGILLANENEGMTWEELETRRAPLTLPVLNGNLWDGNRTGRTALYLGGSDYREISSLLFPGNSEFGYSRQVALGYAQEFERTNNAMYAMESMRTSLRFNHDIEPSVLQWLLRGADKFCESDVAVSMDYSFEINRGKGHSTVKNCVTRYSLEKSVEANLVALEQKFNFGRITARSLLYFRDYESEDSRNQMVKRNFNRLCTHVENFHESLTNPNFFGNWHQLENKNLATQYLQTFLDAYLPPDLEGEVKQKMAALKNDVQD